MTLLTARHNTLHAHHTHRKLITLCNLEDWKKNVFCSILVLSCFIICLNLILELKKYLNILAHQARDGTWKLHTQTRNNKANAMPSWCKFLGRKKKLYSSLKTMFFHVNRSIPMPRYFQLWMVILTSYVIFLFVCLFT